jgi:hypothetical protein
MFAEIDPTKIIRKAKIHLLGHIPEDVRRFGPLVGMATESHESFNAVFRFCSILSNHLAPSRDIAHQTGEQECLKHTLTGGRWLDTQSQEWSRAGPAVCNLLQEKPVLQSMLGWTNPVDHAPGKTLFIHVIESY